MNSVIVIPARMASTRFPNKPIAPILGKIMLERVWRIAQSVRGIDQVFVATDDDGLKKTALGFGAQVLMTRPECENGSERTWDAVRQLPTRPNLVINLQGDAVLTPPWIIEAVLQSEITGIATPATRLTWAECAEFTRARASGDTSGTFVVFGTDGNAFYFSKSMIPFIRPSLYPRVESSGQNSHSTPLKADDEKLGDRASSLSPVYRHIGLYAYRYAALEQYVSLRPTALESIEKLEQLRALENGIPIRIVPVDYKGRTHASVDEPKDLAVVEKIIRREGELVEWT